MYGEFRVLSPAVGRGQTGGRGLALAMEGLSLSLPSELQCCAVTWSGVGLRDSGGTVSLWDVQFRSIVYTTDCERAICSKMKVVFVEVGSRSFGLSGRIMYSKV